MEDGTNAAITPGVFKGSAEIAGMIFAASPAFSVRNAVCVTVSLSRVAPVAEHRSVMAQQQLEYASQTPAPTLSRFQRLALFFGPLFIGTFLPIWIVWYVGPWEATGEAGSFWTALGVLPHTVRVAGLGYALMTFLSSNVVTAGILLFVGFWIERFVSRSRKAASKQAP